MVYALREAGVLGGAGDSGELLQAGGVRSPTPLSTSPSMSSRMG